MATPLFCCPNTQLHIPMKIRSPSETALWNFAWYNSLPPRELDSIPTKATPATLMPSTATLDPKTLSEVPYIIQLEQWHEGEKEQERFFFAHPEWRNEYVEVEKGMIWQEFVRTWAYIKVHCGHERRLFLIKMLERREGSRHPKMTAVQGK